MNKFILSIVFFTLLSCKNNDSASSLKEFSYNGDYWHSIERTQTLGAITYRATQVPLQYYIKKNLGVNNPKKVDSLYQNLADERVVVMEFEEQDGKDLLLSDFTERDYDSSVQYMAFDIQKDFELVIKQGDTIACRGVLFERNFKVAPFKRLLLHFGNIPPEGNVTLIYRDQLFGQGTLQFDFENNPIKL